MKVRVFFVLVVQTGMWFQRRHETEKVTLERNVGGKNPILRHLGRLTYEEDTA
jgi:hypothetical protein